MKTRVLLFLTALTIVAAPLTGAPSSPTFTYNGRLTDGGQPANGNYDSRFILYDDNKSGNAVTRPVIKDLVGAISGLGSGNRQTIFRRTSEWMSKPGQ